MQAILISDSEKKKIKSPKELNQMKKGFKKTRNGVYWFGENIGGMPVSELPPQEVSVLMNKINGSKASTRMMGNTKMKYRTLLDKMRKNDFRPNAQSQKVIRDAKGRPVLLKDYSAIEKYKVLKPLMPVMNLALKSVGETPGKTVDVTAEKFYDKIVRPSGKIGVMNFSQDYPKLTPAQMTVNSADNARDTIVDAILSFARTARNKEDAGQPLTGVEKILADGSRVVERSLTENVKRQASEELGASLLFSRRTQFIVLAAIVGIVLITASIVKK